MSDVNANIGININASSALAELKALQRQIATFHQQVARGSASAAIAQKGLQTNLLNAINATGKFHAQMGLVRTSTESFTHALESNKLSMGQYFRYAGASTKTFGKLFKSEFDTIAKVAQERVKKMQTQYIKMGKDATGATRAMSITPHSLNMKDAATQTAIASQKQAIFNQLVRQGSTNLLNFGKNTQWAGRQLMVGFSVPLLYLGSVAAKVFMDLEKQAVRFKRVYGNMFTTSDETTRALADIQLLAKEFTKYGVAVTDTIKMAADAAAMGKTGAELTAQVAEATRLAVLGGVEQEKALETTISLTNAFGVSAKDLTSKINFLNAVENQTVVSIEDLTIAIPKAGPVVKQLGGDVEDLAFFLTAMKEGGINASEGANALKSGLASLINPSKKAAGMLGDLGINIKGIVEANQGDIRNTVIGFSQALDTLDPLNRARAIEQLFGKFQFSRLSTLFQNVTKDGTQASKVLQLAGASVEELAILSERELKTVEDAVGVNFRESIEKLKLTLVPIGKTFLEALTPVVKVIGNVLDKFNNLGDGTKKFIVIATGLVGFIGPVLLMTFGLLANGLANIIKLFLALRVGFLKMTGDSSSLAATTNYLTAEQLEATTVAASLNQAHTRLTQQFALETTAVSALRSAYVAATIAAAKFAMANPGMMASKRIPKKLARGTSKVPGYAQGTDTVPAMLTPGEAVIPAGTAQDPQFKPIIQAMLDGTIQKYEHGTKKVTQASKKETKMSSKDAFTHVGKAESLLAQDYIKQTPGLTAYDKARINAVDGIVRANTGQSGSVLNYGGLGFSFDSVLNNQLAKKSGVPISVFEKEWLSQGPGKWNATEQRFMVENLHGTDNKIIDDAMLKKIKEEAAKNGGKVTDNIIKQSFKDLPPEAKITKTYESMRGLLESKSKYGIGKGLSHNPKILEQKFRKAVAAGTIANLPITIIDGDATEYKGKPTPLDKDGKPRKLSSVIGSHPDVPLPDNEHVIIKGKGENGKERVGGEYVYDKKLKAHVFLARGASSKSNNVGLRPELGLSEEVKETRKRLKKESLAEMKRIDADVRSSSMAKVKPTDFGKQIAKSTGYSFPGDRSIGGVYEKPDGTRVFVKPFVDEKSAKAELNMNKIHRKIGITTPEQVMKTMADPNNKRRKLIVLESAFDPRFAEEKMTGKFTKGQYFKQLTASLIRGDKDLKRGNVSGNIVTDTGASGVFDKASGRRDYSTNMKSMLGQAEINLLGAPGGRGLSKDFALSTENIPKGMTADQYHRAMIAEIERITPIVKETLRSIPMTNPNEAKAYRDMYRRLVKGKYTDWRSIHKMHSAVEPAFVTKKESFLDEKTGKIEKIKGKKKPKAAKPSTGKSADNKFTVIPPGKKVVQTPKPKRVGRYFVPGYGTAPGVVPTDIFSHKSTTQSQIAANMPVAQSKLVDSMEKSTDANKKVAKESKNLKGKIASGANAVGLVTIGASFLHGRIGELAQKILPLIIGLQIFMMAINSLTKATVVAKLSLLKAAAKSHPYTAALLAIVTVLAAGTLIQKMINANNIKMAKKQSDYIDSISATTEKMKKIAAITNRYSASEVMSIKRQNASSDKFTKNYDRAGQQFGTTFAASEVGKEIFKGFQDDLLRSGTGPAVKSFALQLSGLVSDGVITGVQAGDVARQVAVDFQDMSLYPKIVGDLTSIIGPDGSDILKDPIKVRLEIVKESQNNIESIINRVKGATTGTSSGGGKGASAVQGGRVAFTKADAAIVGAMAVQNLEITQAQIDATNYEYEKKLLSLNVDLKAAKTAKAKLDIQNQIKAAGDKNLEDNKKLNVANADNLKVMQDAFKLTKGDKAATRALMEGAIQQARAKVKGTQSEPFLDPMLELARATGSKSLELKITAIAGAGTNPVLLTNLMGMFKGDNEGLSKNLDLMFTTHGVAEIQTLLSNLNIEKLDDKTKKQLFIDINLVQDKKLFDDLNSTLAILNHMPKDFNINAFLKGDAIGKLRTLTTQLNKIDKAKDVSVSAYVNLIAQENAKGGPGKSGPDLGFVAAMEAVVRNMNYFKSLPDNQQKTATMTFVTAYIQVSEEEMKAETDKLLKSASSYYSRQAILSVAGQKKIQEDLAMRATVEQYVPKADLPKIATGNLPGTTEKAARDTTLDELLNQLKLLRDASINAEGGIKELRRIFEKTNDITMFEGLDTQLKKLGGNDEFISFIGGMSNAVQKGYLDIDLLAKGVVKFTDVGRKALLAFNEIEIGKFFQGQNQSIEITKAQEGALKKLTDAGINTATALEMISDTSLALAINAKDFDATKMATEINRLKDEAIAAKKAVRDFNLEVKNLASGLGTKITTTGNALKAVQAARSAGIVDPEILKNIAQNESLVNEILAKGVNSQTVKSIIDSYIALGKLDETLDGTIDPATAAMNAFLKLKEAMMQVFDAETIDAQNKFDESMKALATTVKGFPDEFKKAYAGLDITGAIEKAEKDIDGLNALIDEIQYKEIRPLEIKIEKAEKEIDAFFRSLETKISGKELKFKDGTFLPDAAYDDVKRKLEDKIAEAELDIEFNKDYGKRFVEGLQESIDKKQLDLEFNKEYGDRFIESLEDNIEKIERGIEETLSRDLEKLQEESSDLSNDLSLIDNIAEGINAKYDKQVEALQKISEINQDLIAQEKSRISLADALSQGDISAAAQIAQEMRSNAAATSANSSANILEKGRKFEIDNLKSESGMTKTEIEKRQFAISQESYKLEEAIEIKKAEILIISDQLYNIDLVRKPILDSIRAIEDQIAVAERIQAVATLEIRKDKDLINAGEIAREKFIRENVEPLEKLIRGYKDDIEAAMAKIAAHEASILKIQNEILGPLLAEKKIKEDILAAELKGIDDKIKKYGEMEAALKKLVTQADLFAAAAGTAETAFAAAKAIYDSFTSKDIVLRVKTIYEDGEAGANHAAADAAADEAAAAAAVAESEAAAAAAAAGQGDPTVSAALVAAAFVDFTGATLDLKRSQEKLKEIVQAFATGIASKSELDEAKLAVQESQNKLLIATAAYQKSRNDYDALIAYIKSLLGNSGGGGNSVVAKVYGGKIMQMMYGGKVTGYKPANELAPTQMAFGGVVPKYMAKGGKIGSDTIPAMLTPGEFVMNKGATKAFGPMLAAINGSKYPSMLANKLTPQTQYLTNLTNLQNQSFTNLSNLSSPTYQTSSANILAPSNISNSTSVNNNSSSVYNYSVGINVGGSNANPQDIARAVMTQIKNVDSQRIRTQR